VDESPQAVAIAARRLAADEAASAPVRGT